MSKREETKSWSENSNVGDLSVTTLRNVSKEGAQL